MKEDMTTRPTSRNAPVVKKAAAASSTPPTRKAVAAPAVAKKGFPARKPLPIFKAPADFKPHFLLVQFTTERDGLIGNKLKAVRYQGKFARDADDKKKFDLASYDPLTLIGLAARLAGVTYKATNDKKFPVDPKARATVKGSHRLPASTTFQVLMRVGKKAADQSLTCGIRQIWQSLQSPKTGRVVMCELEKTDLAYRSIRKASRTLPAAFSQVQMPPKRGRSRNTESDDE